ncbi:MAG: pentapeptide repeat-containing protein [candidate division Zixibacteria bacterium]|nr:pentapeptide repeat-containing protein [candidate division Zixibacteria bacterium]
MDDFNRLVNRKLIEADHQEVDLSGYVFPKGSNIPRDIPEKVSGIKLCGCVFNGDYELYEVHLHTPIWFDDSTFCGRLTLRSVTLHNHFGFKSVTGHGKFAVSGYEFRSSAFFDNSIFHETVSFAGTGFLDTAVFADCEFRASLSFDDVSFRDHVCFERIKTLVAFELKNVKVRFEADFTDAIINQLELSDKTNLNEATFRKARFLNETILPLRFFGGKPIDMSDSDMAYCIVEINKASDLERFKLVGVNWVRKRKFFEIPFSKHFHKFKGIPKEKQLVMMRMYNEYFEEMLRFEEAEYFYVRAMEQVRDVERCNPLKFCVNWLYNLVSRYGESYVRPLCWIAVTLLLTSGFLYWGGVRLEKQVVRFTLSTNVGDLILLHSEFWRIVLLNFSLLPPSRLKPSDYFTCEWQHAVLVLEPVLIVILASFLVMALRRKFRRRKLNP